MLTPQSVAADLDRFLETYLPPAQAIGMKLKHYDGQQLVLTAPLDPNINDKLTAFGGSLFSVTVMTCWGMVYLKCRERGLDPNIVIGHSEIDFLAPVEEELEAICEAPEASVWEQFFARVAERGRARIDLNATVFKGAETAVSYSGRYALIGQK